MLNENIALYRKKKGWSQARMALECDWVRDNGTGLGSRVGDYERGVRHPNSKAVVLMCKALDVTPNELYGWGENLSPNSK